MLFKSDAVIDIDKSKSLWIIQIQGANYISSLNF